MPRVAMRGGRFYSAMGTVNAALMASGRQRQLQMAATQQAAARSSSSSGAAASSPWLWVGALALAGATAWYMTRR